MVDTVAVALHVEFFAEPQPFQDAVWHTAGKQAQNRPSSITAASQEVRLRASTLRSMT